jgi:hypothetical protein
MAPILRRACVLFLTLCLAGVAGAHGGDRAHARESKPESVRLAEELTRELLATRNAQAKLPQARQARPRADVLAIARERHDLLRLLLDSNPADVLRLAMPAGIRAAFPAESQRLIERTVKAEGELDVIHVDMPGKELDYYIYRLKTTTGTRTLHFAGRPTRLLAGSRIRVQGMGLDDDIVLANGGSGHVTTISAALPNTLGVQNTLVILVNFSDKATQPYTPTAVNQVVFVDTSAYDWEASYQQTSLSGAVTPWYTISESSTTCNYDAISQKAEAAAAAGGYTLANYSRRVYIFPGNSCTWWGLGTVGGNPSRSWINTGKGLAVSVVAHEMGHNFGLYHSHSLDCGANVVDGNCTSTEYGDVLDVMGGTPGGGSAHFNAFQKERLGWLGAGISPPLTTVQSGAGQYSIGNMEAARSSTPRAIKIGNTVSACGIAPSEWYYVEKREAVGFDGFIGNFATTIPNSVIIHRVTEGDPDSSYLLDMSPATTTWHDIGLVNGSSFTDPATGLTIQPVSVGAGHASVNVSYAAPSCNNKPMIKLAPAGTVWRVPGESGNFTATVTNTDSCGCPSTTFEVNATAPAGWSSTGAQTSALAPGASANVPVGLTVGAGASAGFYSVPFTATSIANASKNVTANADVSVALPTVLSNGVPITPIAAPTGQGLIYTLQVPAGKTQVTFNTYGGSGDADLYVRFGAMPSETVYDCASTSPFTTESCTRSAQAGTWYVLLHSYAAISGVSLMGQYTPADPVLPALSVNDASIVEGHAGTKQASFTVSIPSPSASAVTVDVATGSGTASSMTDYAEKAVAGLSIPAGQTSASFNVTINGDTAVEGNETFTVNLSNPSNATLADAQGMGRITNDDLATLSIGDVTVDEGNSGATTASFVVRLSAPMPNPVYYDIATGNGTAAGGSDFVARNLGGRFIDAGRTTQVFEVAVNGDASVEGNETFSVAVANVTGAAVADGAATGTIVNDDAAALAPTTAGAAPVLDRKRPLRRRER